MKPLFIQNSPSTLRERGIQGVRVIAITPNKKGKQTTGREMPPQNRIIGESKRGEHYEKLKLLISTETAGSGIAGKTILVVQDCGY